MLDKMIVKNLLNRKGQPMSCCDRCERNNVGAKYCSWYNAQMICSDCREAETKREDYSDCREAEREAISRGDFNFHFLPAWKESR
jgi:hypothetical protein